MVVGTKADVDLREVAYIKNSNDRLAELSQLCSRYKGTPHAEKIQAVLEKTKTIHAYLVGKKKGHELELFHLQHTDHFLNTFTIILDAHQKQQSDTYAAGNRHQKPGSLPEKLQTIKTKQNREAYRQIEMVKPVEVPEQFSNSGKPAPVVPLLGVPSISIDTRAKLLYYKEDTSDNLIAKEIGYTSSELEKEGFMQHVATCLGIRGISYMGNALVTIANNNGGQPTGLVPVIHWEGFLYALNLNDYRLFPVKISRK